MQLITGAKFLNITFLLVLFTATPSVAVCGTVIVPLECMYHYNHINLTLSLTF